MLLLSALLLHILHSDMRLVQEKFCNATRFCLPLALLCLLFARVSSSWKNNSTEQLQSSMSRIFNCSLFHFPALLRSTTTFACRFAHKSHVHTFVNREKPPSPSNRGLEIEFYLVVSAASIESKLRIYAYAADIDFAVRALSSRRRIYILQISCRECRGVAVKTGWF